MSSISRRSTGRPPILPLQPSGKSSAGSKSAFSTKPRYTSLGSGMWLAFDQTQKLAVSQKISENNDRHLVVPAASKMSMQRERTPSSGWEVQPPRRKSPRKTTPLKAAKNHLLLRQFEAAVLAAADGLSNPSIRIFLPGISSSVLVLMWSIHKIIAWIK